jgi:ubiquitin C-terminal hydrolase
MLDKHIKFPSELNLDPFMSDEEDKRNLYELCGAIIYYGNGVKGHYVSYVKNHCWFKANDEEVYGSH